MVQPGAVKGPCLLMSCCPEVRVRVIADPGLWQGFIYCNWTMTKGHKDTFFPGQPKAPWGVCILRGWPCGAEHCFCAGLAAALSVLVRE
jgi:hypothetical protein